MMPKFRWIYALTLVGLVVTTAVPAFGAPSQVNAEKLISPAARANLDRIAAALEAANRKGPSPDERQSAKANLNAQQEMSATAAKMFWVGTAEVSITLLGVILVLCTLLYTRRAAVAAERALDEARRAGDAAVKSAEAAIGSERAWVLLKMGADNLEEAVLQRIDPKSWSALINDKPVTPEVACHVENMGKTPAFIREFSTKLICAGEAPPIPDYGPLAPWWPEETILPAGARLPALTEDGIADRVTMISSFELEAAKSFDSVNYGSVPRGRFWFYGRIVYADVWGIVHSTTFCFAHEVWSGWFIPPDCTHLNERT